MRFQRVREWLMLASNWQLFLKLSSLRGQHDTSYISKFLSSIKNKRYVFWKQTGDAVMLQLHYSGGDRLSSIRIGLKRSRPSGVMKIESALRERQLQSISEIEWVLLLKKRYVWQALCSTYMTQSRVSG